MENNTKKTCIFVAKQGKFKGIPCPKVAVKDRDYCNSHYKNYLLAEKLRQNVKADYEKTQKIETVEVQSVQEVRIKPELPKSNEIETPKPKSNEIETPKPKTPKIETPKIETPKPKSNEIETPKPKTPKIETPITLEIPKPIKPKTPKIETTQKKIATKTKKTERDIVRRRVALKSRSIFT
jgi:hypothetical protein